MPTTTTEAQKQQPCGGGVGTNWKGVMGTIMLELINKVLQTS